MSDLFIDSMKCYGFKILCHHFLSSLMQGKENIGLCKEHVFNPYTLEDIPIFFLLCLIFVLFSLLTSSYCL
jgi:hypothetical protein